MEKSTGNPVGRPPSIKGIVLAQKIKAQDPNLTERQIAKLMAPQFGRQPDPKEVWRWLRKGDNHGVTNVCG